MGSVVGAVSGSSPLAARPATRRIKEVVEWSLSTVAAQEGAGSGNSGARAAVGKGAAGWVDPGGRGIVVVARPHAGRTCPTVPAPVRLPLPKHRAISSAG